MTSELPLPNYDNLPIEAIQSRARTLDEAGVNTLLAYEEAHANRPAVVTGLQTRAAELEDGAQPSGGSPTAFAPESGTRGDEPSPPAIKEGPPVNPPSHGTPWNPAQPRH